MPRWGHAADLAIDEKYTAWGLPKDLLKPMKTITDPVHGDVHVTAIERLIIDSPSFQRLRRVKQLGTTHLVYPGATHTRFSHSLGTMRAAQDLLDAVWFSRLGPASRRPPSPNLLEEWDDAGQLDERFADATVLARLGGLLHDLCHIPLGHTIEDDLKVLDPHDANMDRFRELWGYIDAEAREPIEARPELFRRLRRLIISKGDIEEPDSPASTDDQTNNEFAFVEDIVGNTICADLIDYLRRDHLNTGLPLAIGERFLSSFYISSRREIFNPCQMVIQTASSGKDRADITTELLKYLRYRYELTERVLTHHAKTSADAMIGKMLEMWSDELAAKVIARTTDYRAVATGLDLDREVSEAFKQLDADAARNLSGSDRTDTPDWPSKRVRNQVKREVETEFLRRSDDGLLEKLRDHDSSNGRGSGIAQLASAVLDRDLFKPVGRADAAPDRARRDDVWTRFGSPADRQAVERATARYAGLDKGWHVVLWIPKPTMRLKLAEVLVNAGNGPAQLAQVEPASKSITDAHEALWFVGAYLHPNEVRQSIDGVPKIDIVLAYLSDHLGLQMRRTDGDVSPGARRLAARHVLSKARAGVDRAHAEQQLVEVSEVAASHGSSDFANLLADTRRQASIAGLLA